MTRSLVVAILATVAVGATLLGSLPATGATAGTCVAHIAGVETSRKTPAELVVLNTSNFELTLDMTLRAPDGSVVLDSTSAIVVPARGTVIRSLEADLSAAVPPKTKPYEGLVSIELRGAAPFAADSTVVHATQYYGKRKKPRGAVVLRPLFRTEDEQ